MDATRRDLAEAATDLIIRKGYSSTTVADIAQEAGVGRRTFFRHYPTKEDVILQSVLAEFADFDDLLNEVENTGDHLADAATAMRLSVEERRSHLDDSITFYRIVRTTPELGGVVKSFNEAFEQCFSNWYAARTGTDPADSKAQIFGKCAIAVRETALSN